MVLPDLYELHLAYAQIVSAARLRGEYSDADLARLEDIAEQTGQIVEQELRDRSTFNVIPIRG